MENLIEILEIIARLEKILKYLNEDRNNFMLIASEQNAYLG